MLPPLRLRSDYYTYDPATGCSTEASITTATQTIRGGSPTMSVDMLRLTGEDTLPSIAFSMMPMSYPNVGSNPADPEMADLTATWAKFHEYMGSELDITTDFNVYPTYGAEPAMVLSVASKVLEMASTTCNRDFYAFIEAPAYTYDWETAVQWVEARRSSFFVDESCSCFTNSTCQSLGTVTINLRGWAPEMYPALPMAEADNGMMYMPNSTDPNSPWFQTNVLPGNPIGRFNECITPRERCLCDGVYWYPSFVGPDHVLRDIKCYSWAMSLTKIYSARLRGGVVLVMNTEAATTAARAMVGGALANGLYSHMQLQGQIQLMETMMSKPFSEPTSWLNALRTGQYEKWDVMYDALAVCEAAGIMKITAEQPKYFGAYIFAHLMPDYQGMAADVGGSSSDFFLSVIGYDHYNYNWGWLGEVAGNYGNGVDSAKITYEDFTRIHLFRGLVAYEEEARRMNVVCSDMDARATPGTLTMNEWIALRSADMRRRRRLEDGPISHHARALEVQAVAPKMKLINAIKFAMETDPHRKLEWEYGMPRNLPGVVHY
jgi:hypothetical protein